MHGSLALLGSLVRVGSLGLTGSLWTRGSLVRNGSLVLYGLPRHRNHVCVAQVLDRVRERRPLAVLSGVGDLVPV